MLGSFIEDLFCSLDAVEAPNPDKHGYKAKGVREFSAYKYLVCAGLKIASLIMRTIWKKDVPSQLLRRIFDAAPGLAHIMIVYSQTGGP